MSALLADPLPCFHAEYPWGVVRVKTGKEREAESHLIACGSVTYVPRYTHVRRWAHRAPETLWSPLFAGYVFAAIPPDQHYDAVRSQHVLGPLRFGQESALMSVEELLRIQALTTMAAQPWEKFAAGDKVRVNTGAVTVEGVVIQQKPPMQIVVEITMLQRFVRIEVDGFQVEPA